MNQNELAHQITDLVEGRSDTVINWHDPRLEMPELSGYYLIMLQSGTVMHVPYSANYEEFNARDISNEADIAELRIRPKYWARIKYGNESKLPQAQESKEAKEEEA